jgi:hypothetical protein
MEAKSVNVTRSFRNASSDTNMPCDYDNTAVYHSYRVYQEKASCSRGRTHRLSTTKKKLGVT